jgi:predicted metal-dependent hydrolase
MPRPDATDPLPPYSFVPGGPWPHPTRSPQGHSFGRATQELEAIDPSEGSRSRRFLRGVELFNAGFYWEAHESWEALWHAHGRHGPTADVLKGLIKLAAAGVKVREGQEHGVRTHARRAAESFARARDRVGRHHLGLDLDQWIERSRALAEQPPSAPRAREVPVARVFRFDIELSDRGIDVIDET